MVGTIIAICFSFPAYRMAKRTGRSAALWIVMVWVLGTVFATFFGFMGAVVDVALAGDEAIDSGTVQPYLSFWASVAGTVIGGATAVLLAGRPVSQATNQATDRGFALSNIPEQDR